MRRLLAIAFILATVRVINSDEHRYGSAPRPVSVDAFTTEQVNFAGGENSTENETETYEQPVSFSFTETQFHSTKLIKKCDEKRTLNNCEEESGNTSEERAKHGNGALSSTRSDGKEVEQKGPHTFPIRPTTAVAKSFMEFKSKTILDHQEGSERDKIHEISTVVNYLSNENERSEKRIEFEQVLSTKPSAAETPQSALTISQMSTTGKSSVKVSLRRPWDVRPTTLAGSENLVRIRNMTDEKMVSRRPKIHELIRLTNDSHNSSRQPTQEETSFGTVRYVKPLDIIDNNHPATTQQSDNFLTFSTLLSSTMRSTILSYDLQASAVSPEGFNRTNKNDTIDKLSQEIPWPVKKESIVEGDIILGGLMMVHEREDSITCGPVMPQGGIQALEAMLFTLDQLNSSPEPLLPNITLGAHILDDCDKDTYGLEMAVDFIKERGTTSGTTRIMNNTGRILGSRPAD